MLQVVSSDWFKCVIVYHMTGSASGQGEVNPMFWLAPQVGKIGLSCPFRIARFVSTKTFISHCLCTLIFLVSRY